MSVAIILGSSFSKQVPKNIKISPVRISTFWGTVTLYQVLVPQREDTPSWLVFRHGLPHQILPHQVNFRGYIAALKEVGCRGLITCSSVGVLDPQVPLYRPMFAADLLMPDQRLPSGEVCSMFTTPQAQQGHLVLQGRIFSDALQQQIIKVTQRLKVEWGPDVNFAYVPGPRTKTALENKYWLQLGAQVNSMSIGPEVVLAQEMQIPTAALLVGHKYSTSTLDQEKGQHPLMVSDSNLAIQAMQTSLINARQVTEAIVEIILKEVQPVDFDHYLYRF